MDPDGTLGNVVAYTGHRLLLDHPTEELIVREMSGVLDRRSASYGFGSLCWGADILWAERLLARAAELHVLLPCGERAFLRASLAGPGVSWTARFWSVHERATSVTIVGPPDSVSEAGYRETADQVFAMAVAASEKRASTVSLVAVWDGESSRGVAGTAADVAAWVAMGRDLDALDPHGARYLPSLDEPDDDATPQ